MSESFQELKDRAKDEVDSCVANAREGGYKINADNLLRIIVDSKRFTVWSNALAMIDDARLFDEPFDSNIFDFIAAAAATTPKSRLTLQDIAKELLYRELRDFVEDYIAGLRLDYSVVDATL
ncbi:MAG: hypothetical protein ACRC7P_09930 [Enterovibrio sp.]